MKLENFPQKQRKKQRKILKIFRKIFEIFLTQFLFYGTVRAQITQNGIKITKINAKANKIFANCFPKRKLRKVYGGNHEKA